MAFGKTTSDISYRTLDKEDFQRVRSMLHEYCGIYLNEGKEALVRARLMKRIRKLGIGSFWEYLDFVESDESGAEFLSLVDVLTTNKTSFFRENQHFDFIRDEILPNMKSRSCKWWSAGCSSGEEPVTMAITLLENQRYRTDYSVKILATDLSRDVLRKAKDGIYTRDRLADIPGPLLNKYFKKDPDNNLSHVVAPKVQDMITYGRLNLKDNWPMKGPFHVIMCRNVMIYFNRETQANLVSRFYNLLEPGGYLFLGHSESVGGNNHGFANIRPAVYQKKGG